MSEISDLFKNYKSEAFRLEMLPLYHVFEEWGNFQKYQKSGVVKQDAALIEYINEAKQKIENGKRHIRVRVIPNPLTEYFVFETKIGYIPQSKIGFELNFIEKNSFNLLFPNYSVGDFWLFDKYSLLQMNYDCEGKFISAVIIKDKNIINEALEIRNTILSESKTLSYVIDNYIK